MARRNIVERLQCVRCSYGLFGHFKIMNLARLSYSPAYPAFLLLYGMIPALAWAHFFGISWQRPMTIAFYTALLVWSLFVVWRSRRLLLPPVIIDVLFFVFVLVILVSLASQGDFWGGAGKHYEYFLPFMVVTPYLCGRVMRDGDIAHLARVVICAGWGCCPSSCWIAWCPPQWEVRAGRFSGMITLRRW